MNHGRDNNKKDESSMAHKFFTACLLFLGGALILTLAIEVLTQIWVWLVVIGILTLALWVTYRLRKSRRDRW
ncbi:Hypotetical protein [Gulosibacter molinativorax]|nr:Hypotetical protein [Gulosibacter molinativorax]